jgi:N-acetylglucosaminyldiphosphoundecaprenol N-acetyl-beta-D-mannosaminyltransferase
MIEIPEPTLTVVPCVGVPITACTPHQAALEVVRLATTDLDHGVDIHLCNAYTLSLADKDSRFKALLQRASVNFPDGKSVVWANKLLHRSRTIPSERVYGPDLLLDVFEKGQELGLRHYLLGSTPRVLSRMETELGRRFPKATIVGSVSPPFRILTELEAAEQTARLVDSKAHVVWVGLGTPKQDWEAARLANDIAATFVAVGAAFDFIAGEKKQAPKWMQRNGLEWLFRLVVEPRRLWRRYLFGNARFLSATLMEMRRTYRHLYHRSGLDQHVGPDGH